MKKHLFQKQGDTIIEVMFATAVASLIIVMAMAVMNRGVATTQMAVEHTFVRQGIDAQAESLRYFRDNKGVVGTNSTAATWSKIQTKTVSEATPFGTCNSLSGQSFYIDLTTTGTNMIKNASITPSGEIFATPGRGMWIEAVTPSSAANYIDFHIRACWEPPFSGPKATLGTIVRLTK